MVAVTLLVGLLAVAIAAVLWRRSRTPVFATACILICGATLLLAVMSANRFYASQTSIDRYVEGKGLFDALFFSSAFAGFWLALATTRVLVEALGGTMPRATRIVSAAAGFTITFVAAIPMNMYLAYRAFKWISIE